MVVGTVAAQCFGGNRAAGFSGREVLGETVSETASAGKVVCPSEVAAGVRDHRRRDARQSCEPLVLMANATSSCRLVATSVSRERTAPEGPRS